MINCSLEETKQTVCSLFVDCNTVGAFSNGGTKRPHPLLSDGCYPNLENYYDSVFLNASNSNSIYGSSSTVQPASLVLNYMIKY